jgi:hypothetical protein
VYAVGFKQIRKAYQNETLVDRCRACVYAPSSDGAGRPVLCEEGDMTVERTLKMPNNPYAKTFNAILLAMQANAD